VQNRCLIRLSSIITGIKIGDDDEVPGRISGGDTQVIEESVLDRALAPAHEVK
jgi:hypothetical protein